MLLCNLFKNAFTKSSSLVAHQETAHKIKPCLICPICKYISPLWKSCLKHINACKKKEDQETIDNNEMNEAFEMNNELVMNEAVEISEDDHQINNILVDNLANEFLNGNLIGNLI